jgi:hypothetical protein
MALARYYRSDPTATSSQEFLAGFLNRRHEVHAQEAGLEAAQTRQDQQLYAGGLGSMLDPLVRTRQLQYGQGQANQRQRMAIEGRRQLEMLSQMGVLNRDAIEDYQTAYGTLPSGPTAEAAPQGPQAPTGRPPTLVPGAGGMAGDNLLNWQKWPSASVPDPQPDQATVPRPVIDPASTSQYQQEYDRLQKMLSEKRALVDTNPFLSDEERAAQTAAYTPEIARLQKGLKGYKPPKEPTTYQELVQSGKVIPVPGTNSVVTRNQKGEYKVSDVERAPQAGQKTQVTLSDGTEVALPPNSARVVEMADGTMVGIKTNDKGTPDFEKLATPDRPFDRSKFFEKVIGKVDVATGKSISVDKAMQMADEIETAIDTAKQREVFRNVKSTQSLLDNIYGEELGQARKLMSRRSLSSPFNERDAVAARSMAQKIVEVMRMYNAGQIELAADVFLGLRQEMEFLREIAQLRRAGLAPFRHVPMARPLGQGTKANPLWTP